MNTQLKPTSVDMKPLAWLVVGVLVGIVVGVLVRIVQGVFFNWASPLDCPPPKLLGLAPP